MELKKRTVILLLFILIGWTGIFGCGSGGGGDSGNSGGEGNTAVGLRGVNLAGAEFGEDTLPGTYGVDYIYPNSDELDYYKSKCIRLIRLPFRWERLQPSLYGPLDVDELARLDEFIAAVCTRNMKVILDPHNYARYHGDLIGSPQVPLSAFTDFWERVASQYRIETCIYAYGLMNEPHDTNGRWPEIAQAGIDGIRLVDMNHLILVPGDGWSSAENWPQNNPNLSVIDIANKFKYEAHVYFDWSGSGAYDMSYDDDGAYPNIGIDRVNVFLNWLKARGAKGFIGEYGVPDTDVRWLTVLENFLAHLEANTIGGTCWAGGPWWGDYPLSVEPRNGQDQPQMELLTEYSGVQCSAD
jgi:endoglucanase